MNLTIENAILENNMKKLTILGAGAWGSALAAVLGKNFDTTFIWSYLEDEANDINKNKVNSNYLPGVLLQNVTATTSIETALQDSEIIISVVPSFAIRQTWTQVKNIVKNNHIFINASKGVEKDTHFLPYQLFEELFGQEMSYFSLCGPSFASDVAEGKPTAVSLAGKDQKKAEEVIKNFKNGTFHLRYSDDVIGTELGAIFKNVIAIASGMVLGKQFGPNTQALVVVEGMKELRELGEKMGAKQETFFGLAGLGDLLLTAMNNQSRNMNFGIELGKGISLDQALKDQKGVAEGYYTTLSLDYLMKKYSISLPLCSMMADILLKKMPIQKRFDQFMQSIF
jgi:glycerol-3-phosphate dehydrogenase (NAD(P)+)